MTSTDAGSLELTFAMTLQSKIRMVFLLARLAPIKSARLALNNHQPNHTHTHMSYDTFITIAVTLRQSIDRLLDSRNDSSLIHRQWVRKELRKSIQALRDIRKIGVTY